MIHDLLMQTVHEDNFAHTLGKALQVFFSGPLLLLCRTCHSVLLLDKVCLPSCLLNPSTESLLDPVQPQSRCFLTLLAVKASHELHWHLVVPTFKPRLAFPHNTVGLEEVKSPGTLDGQTRLEANPCVCLRRKTMLYRSLPFSQSLPSPTGEDQFWVLGSCI